MGSGTFGTVNVSYGGTVVVAPGNSPQSSSVAINNGTIAGNGLFAAPTTIATTAIVSASGALTLAENISGAGQLIAMGPGTVTLSGSNSYLGGTMVAVGTLQVGASAALPSGAPATVDGTLDLGSFGANLGALTGSGTVNHNGPGRNTLTISSGDFNGMIESTAGTLALLKTGSGQLILSGDDDYRGGTTVAAGELEVESAEALARGTSLIVGNGGGFIFGASPAEAPVAVSSPAASPDPAVAAVPEPGTLALLSAAGIVAMAVWRRKRRRGK
jgi:autotransporter-associated beta strand protein